jgi:glycerate dehydrogenase
MRIVVLDGFTLNPGDLSWDPLRSLGECSIFDRTPPTRIPERSREAEIILTNKTPIVRSTLDALPRLRYIGVLATGFNIVDVGAARERGIPVTNVPAYSTMSVAQVVFAHLFNLTHGMGHHTAAVREGRWISNPDFSFWDSPLIEVSGLTMGIVGLGRIGTAVARIALALGMHVIAVDPTAGSGTPPGVTMVTVEELFRLSDVVTLHCPLTPATQGIVNRDRLALMKRSAYLINTSRGPLVDSEALAAALNAGTLAGAGLDVLAEEPPPATNPLLLARNCSITPHFAWASTAARARLMHEVVENIQAFQRGETRNVVNIQRP